MGGRASKISRLVARSSPSRWDYERLGADHNLLQVPKGYFPICVGISERDCTRFIVQTKVLGDADFLQLLRRSGEEYGFVNQGILRIPYEAKDFEELMLRITKVKVIRVD